MSKKMNVVFSSKDSRQVVYTVRSIQSKLDNNPLKLYSFKTIYSNREGMVSCSFRRGPKGGRLDLPFKGGSSKLWCSWRGGHYVVYAVTSEGRR